MSCRALSLAVVSLAAGLLLVNRPAEASPQAAEGVAEPAAQSAASSGDQTPPGEAAVPPAGGRRTASDSGVFPTLDIDLPEGDLDLRASRLVGRILFQGQVKYNFVDGDITAFLRYRLYGPRRVYQLSGFDSLEFGSVEKLSGDFERVRGLLHLVELPLDYHHRVTLLTELDRISSNKDDLRFDNNTTNTFLRLGYQIGTPGDERSNAIVGERRAKVDRLFTAQRLIGPGGAGLSTGLTWGSDVLGDYSYLKLEAEGLKRWELGREVALVGRLHLGSFPYRKQRDLAAFEDVAIQEGDRYLIPRNELFRLDGRDNLKGLKDSLRGTEELHTTFELFFPWFLDEDRRALRVTWNRWYWVLYSGYGTVGFDRQVYTDSAAYFTDVGAGFQTSFRLRRYVFFVSAVVAQTLEEGGSPTAKLSIKSYH